ncbi:hypothetical protein SS50377_22252 [Spironucleus salmonicida]|nr:hypothetical protein SS50377_22252 [Spironucleus salmonicida]
MKTDHQLYDGLIKLNFEQLSIDIQISHIQLIVQFIQNHQIIEFPSIITDTQENQAEIPISIIQPLLKGEYLIQLQINFLVIDIDKVIVIKKLNDIIMLQELDQEGIFPKLKVKYIVDLQENYDRIQFLQLQNLFIDCNYVLELDDLWVQLQTPYLSISRKFLNRQLTNGLCLPQCYEFIVKVQQKIQILDHVEFITIQQIQFESTSTLEKGHQIELLLIDYLDQHVYKQIVALQNFVKQSTDLKQFIDIIPPDYFQRQFNLNDINLPQFKPDQLLKVQKGQDESNFKSIISFVCTITKPMLSFRERYDSSSQYYQDILGEFQGILGFKVNGQVGFYGISQNILKISQITQKVVMQGLNNYIIKINQNKDTKIASVFLNDNYFYFPPTVLYLVKGGLQDIIDTSPIFHVIIFQDGKEVNIQLNLKLFKNQILSNLLENKQTDIIINGVSISVSGFQSKQQNKVSKIQPLFSSRLNIRSTSQLIDLPLFDEGHSDNTSFSLSLASGRSLNLSSQQQTISVLTFDFCLEKIKFHELATHYSAKITIVSDQHEYYFEHSINTIEDTNFKISLQIPILWLDANVVFQLIILQFNEDNFIFVDRKVLLSNLNILQKIQQNILKLMTRGQFCTNDTMVSFLLEIKQNSNQMQYLYINNLDIDSDLDNLFESKQKIWVEVQTSSFSIKQLYTTGQSFNISLPYYQDNNDVLLKILLEIDVFDVKQYLHIQSITVYDIGNFGLQGQFFNFILQDYISEIAAKTLETINQIRDPQIIKNLSEQLPINFWQQQFNIPQVDNNNIIVTPGLLGQTKINLPNFTSKIKFLLKISEKGFYHSRYYINSVEFLTQIKNNQEKICILSNLYTNYFIIAQKQSNSLDFMDKILNYSRQYNYNVYPITQKDVYINFINKNKFDILNCIPLILDYSWLGECQYSIVQNYQNLGSYKIKFQDYLGQIQQASSNTLDYEIPNIEPQFKVAVSINVKLGVIDEDVNDEGQFDDSTSIKHLDEGTFFNISIFGKNTEKVAQIETNIICIDEQVVCQQEIVPQLSHKRAFIAPNYFKKYPEGKKRIIPVTLKNNYNVPKQIKQRNIIKTKQDLHEELVLKGNIFLETFAKKKQGFQTQKFYNLKEIFK